MTTDPPGLDLGRLQRYLDLATPRLATGPLAAEPIIGGKSNLTYFLADGTSSWVLRRPPLGHVLPTAHNMAREFRMLSALAPTSVPVPQPLLLCEDETVIGAPFYLMERVDGRVYRSADDAAGISAAEAAALTDSLLDVLAELHAIDPDAVGLGDFGHPAGFLHRQLRRWRAQLDASRSRPLPGIDELHEALTRSVPESSRPAIVHGDYRLDNVIVGPGGRINAVVDWEMTTIGDPLADLGLMIVYWDGLSMIPGSVSAAVGPGTAFPRGPELIRGYAERRSVELSAMPWYVAFGYFKLAVIAEGIHYRYVAGQTVGEGFEGMGEHTPTLVRLGRESLEEE
jgi:aminoglycoside phosphotransferase (APT) family kinase protein